MTCLGCDPCPMTNGPRVPTYELHITLAPTYYGDNLEWACSALGLRPLVIDLDLDWAKRQVMTQCVVTGDWREPLADRARGLRLASLTVLRQKVEAAPWCPEVPTRQNGLPFAPGEYMEGHIKVKLPERYLPGPLQNVMEVGRLRGLARAERAHLSSTPSSPGVYFVTQRAAVPAEDFITVQLNLSATLVREGYRVLKSIVEFTVHDTTIGIDGNWGRLP